MGKWKTEPIDIELKENIKPYHAKPFSVPKYYKGTSHKEVQHLEKLGILKKINRSEWAAPTFLMSKKNGTIRFLSDFR